MIDRKEVEALKPCPFCGGAAMVELIEPHQHQIAKFMPDYGGGCVITCACAVALIREGGDYEADAITAWNTRHG